MNEFKLDSDSKIAAGFKTPEHYFDEFPHKVSRRLLAEQTKVLPLQSRKKTLLLAAAAILVLALSIPIFNKISTKSSEFDVVAAENYLSMQAGISDHLIELLDEEDIQKINIDINLEDKAVEDLLSTNPNLEQYIIN